MKHYGIIASAIACLLAFGAPMAQSSEVVRMGVLTDMSGPLADSTGKGSLLAAELAAEDFGGKVLGKKIEVLSGDHQNKPDLGSSIARGWIDNEDVNLLLDLGNSGVAIGIQTIVEQKNKISMAVGATTSELSNKYCNPNSFAWAYDTYQFAKASTSQLLKQGYKKFFFVTVDYAFGHALEDDTRRVIEAGGGEVVGSVKHPINNMDFSSHLLQAQASGADVILFASAGADLQNSLKQGKEFGIFEGRQKLPLALLISDIPAVGLEAAQGTVLSSVAYWDANEETRKFTERFKERMGRVPTEAQALTYSAATHYLKAVEAAGTTDTDKVLVKIRELPVNDAFTSNGQVRADGRLMRDIHLVRVKSPEESKKPSDYFEIISEIEAEDAFRPVAESSCALLK